MDALTSATMVQTFLANAFAPMLTTTGHAGALLQARRLGKELYVGVHSDDAILENKGPTVMSLLER